MKHFISFTADEEFVKFQEDTKDIKILSITPTTDDIIVVYEDIDENAEELPMTLTIQDDEDIRRAMAGLNLCSTIWDFQQYMRGMLKYGDDKLSNEEYKMVEQINDRFYDILVNENNVNLEEIYS